MAKVVDLQKHAVNSGSSVGEFLRNLGDGRHRGINGSGRTYALKWIWTHSLLTEFTMSKIQIHSVSNSGQSSAWIDGVQWREMLSKSRPLYGTEHVFRFHCEPADSKFDVSTISRELAAPGYMDLKLKPLKNTLYRCAGVVLVLIAVVSPLSSAGLYAA